MLAAKQNQKSPFHFLSAPPTPPAEEKKKGKENFWVLLPRPKGADEARRIRAYDLVSLHHARGACNIFCFEKRYELSTINTPKQNSTAFSKPESGTREARKGMETLARRARRGSPSAGSKSLAILSICFAQ